MKMILKLSIIFASISLFAQADESVELKVGDEAPTWALMYAPGLKLKLIKRQVRKRNFV